MPDKAITNILANFLELTQLHRKQAYFLEKGIRMGIVRLFPLTIWIKQLGRGEILWEEEWVFLPDFLRAKPASRTEQVKN